MTKVLADMPNKETMSSIYEAIADMSDHHLKVAFRRKVVSTLSKLN